jgi:hypothetical protein
MNIKIQRNISHGEYTHGTLSIDGTKICHTLENAKSQVPAGQYPITLVKCKQYSRKMPLLLNLEPGTEHREPCCNQCPKLPLVYSNTTLPCYCPMLKPGNGVHNRLDGSILVGRYNCFGSLIHPREPFDSLYERIRKSISRGNTVTLTITAPPKRYL